MIARARHRTLAGALSLGALLACAAVGAGAAAESIGTVTAVEGQAAARRGGDTVDLAPQAALQREDRLTTGPASRLAARLADDTQISLGENATMVLDRFVYRESGPGQAILDAVRGAFLVIGGSVESSKGSRFIVKTPSAAIALRGTTVWGGHIDSGYGIFVAEGSVRVTGRRGSVTLRKGEGTTLDKAGRPSTPRDWPQEKVRRALGMVNVAR
jgi:hypothetical protein